MYLVIYPFQFLANSLVPDLTVCVCVIALSKNKDLFHILLERTSTSVGMSSVFAGKKGGECGMGFGRGDVVRTSSDTDEDHEPS